MDKDMAMNIKQHIEHHAELFVEKSEYHPSDLHFNFSYLDLQFLNRDPKTVMCNLLDELMKPTSYKEPNGWRKNKEGNDVQKFTNRKIDLSQSIKIYALHLKGLNEEDTMPHIHFLHSPNERFGRNYSLLRKHISIVSEKFGLTPNFDVMKEANSSQNNKKLASAIKNLSWQWRKMTNEALRKSFEDKGIENAMKILLNYTLQTSNLTYYIKTMEHLKSRLNSLRVDIFFDGHNIRQTYPIPLLEQDMEVIELIQNREFSQKAIKPYLHNHLFRDYVRYSAKTTTPYIVNAIKKQTKLLDGIKGNQKVVDNYRKLTEKEEVIKKSRLSKSDNQKIQNRVKFKEDLFKVVESSTNEKTLRANMNQAGYSNFGLKKHRGRVVGCFYEENQKRVTYKFIDLNINYSEIKKELMSNQRKENSGEDLPQNKIIKQAVEPLPKRSLTPTPKTIEIEYKSEAIAKQKAIKKEQAKQKREKDGLIAKFKKGISWLKRQIGIFENKIFNAQIRYQELRKSYKSEVEQYDNEISTHEQRNQRIEADIQRTRARNDGLRESIASAKNDESRIRGEIKELEESRKAKVSNKPKSQAEFETKVGYTLRR
jgi:hypothetical protein